MAAERRKRSEWQQLMDELKASGLTQQEFASARGLNANTLENWFYRLRREARRPAPPASFLPIRVRATAPTSSIGHDGGLIEVVVGETFRVRFAPGVDCGYLGRLLAEVARSAAC